MKEMRSVVLVAVSKVSRKMVSASSAAAQSAGTPRHRGMLRKLVRINCVASDRELAEGTQKVWQVPSGAGKTTVKRAM